MEFKLLDENISRKGLIKGAVRAAGLTVPASAGLGFLSKAEAKGGSYEKMAVAICETGPRKNN